MYYLILSILTFSSILLLFKAFERFGIHNFHAIVINYLVATSLGYLLTGKKAEVLSVFQSDWLIYAILVGAFFISVFYLIAISSQKVGVSATAVSSKMSVIVPIVFAFFLYEDRISVLKVSGILMALLSIYLTLKKGKGSKFNLKYIALPLLVFVGSGLVDTLIKYTEEAHLNPEQIPLFVPTVFLFAGLLGCLVLVFQVTKRKKGISFSSLLGGTLLGTLNYATLFFLVKALNVDQFESSVVFPLNNMGIVVTTALGGVLIYGEKLSKINAVGILLSLIAIAMIAYS